MARTTRSELTNRLGVLLAHLLKWRFNAAQQQLAPHHRGAAGRDTVASRRQPSLKAMLPDSFERGYRKGLRRALKETGLERQTFPPETPWTRRTLDDDFYPE